jgi:hypothetical protein
MKDPDLEPQFSWPLALFITGSCFLVFFYTLAKLNGTGPRVFLWIALTSLAIAFLASVVSKIVRHKQNSQPDNMDQ